MPWWTLLGGLIKEGLEHWRERGQAKHEAKLEEIKHKAKWEAEMADATKYSLKDEYVLVIVSLPIWSIFYGAVTDNADVNYRVGLAMNQLDALPDWYRFTLVTIFLASYGIRLGGALTSMLGKKK